MDLQTYQIFLAKLYTDPAFREQFWAEPQALAQANGIDSETAEKIRQLPYFQFFSQSLIHKRLHIVRQFMPLSWEVLGEKKYNLLFEEFAPTFQTSETQPYQLEAWAFSQFVLKKNNQQSFLSLLQKEILRFEQAVRRLRFEHKRNFIFYKIFAYPVHHFWQKKQALQPQKTVWIFIRIFGKVWLDRLFVLKILRNNIS